MLILLRKKHVRLQMFFLNLKLNLKFSSFTLALIDLLNTWYRIKSLINFSMGEFCNNTIKCLKSNPNFSLIRVNSIILQWLNLRLDGS